MTMLPPAFHRFRDAIRRGEKLRSAGRFREAVEAFTDAMIVRGGDLTPDQEADLRIRTAECYLELGDVESADLALAPTEKLDSGRLLPGTRGALHTVRGFLELNRGNHEETVRQATFAWNVLRDTDENFRVYRALTARGHGYRRLGRLEEARDDYTDALAAARRAGLEHEVGIASANLGYLLWQSGRYAEALPFHRRAVEIHERTGSDAQITRELFALSVDEFHLGRWSKVEALLTRCEERARKDEDNRLLSGIEISRGRLQLARGEDPRPALERARRIAESAGYTHDLVGIGIFLGEAAMERGDWDEARRLLTEASERVEKSSPNGESAVDVAWRLAKTEEALGDPDGNVVSRLEKALELCESREYRAQEAMVRRTLGEVLANRGAIDEARAHLETSVSILRDLRMPLETGKSLLSLASFLAGATSTPEVSAPLFREAEAVLRELGAERETERAVEGLAAATGETVARPETDGGDPFSGIVTGSDVMSQSIQRARRIAPSSIPVLLTGETGTGKELFARAIHDGSSRAGQPFLALNCAALSETLLEAELFGHEKGAFTGAASAKAGIFEAANGGTVFLDEIGKAPLSLQAKLLRVLDTGEVRRVGGVVAIHVDVRIVAATNRSLQELVSEESFLPDLLYRLRGFEIVVPPLRERGEDVAKLFEHFAKRPASAAALDLLAGHGWPGNVRELRNLAESAAFLACGTGPIPADALPEWIREDLTGSATVESLEDAEKMAVIRALAESGGNRAAAARSLGISRQTLYTKLSKFGIGRANAA